MKKGMNLSIVMPLALVWGITMLQASDEEYYWWNEPEPMFEA